MKRIVLVILVIILVLSASCGGMSTEEAALREKFPEYFDLPTSKGLEVYVWQLSAQSYSCGVLSGTNRNKTKSEILALTQNSATVDEMKRILSYYDIPESDIAIIPVYQLISSYHYEIDDEYSQKIREMFKGDGK